MANKTNMTDEQLAQELRKNKGGKLGGKLLSLLGVIVAMFSYLGVEAIAVAAGEAQHPQKAVQSAMKTTVLRLVLFYLLTLALMLAIVPWTEAATQTSPFVRVM